MDVAAFSPTSFFAGLIAGVILTLLVRGASSSRTRPPPTPMVPLTGHLEDDVRALLEAGQKIEAIKLVRERTGCGLKEAKDHVEEFERGKSR